MEQHEELKDKIREEFIGKDIERLLFLTSEWGHSYINTIKELLIKVVAEEKADVLKYIIGLGIPTIIIIWMLL